MPTPEKLATIPVDLPAPLVQAAEKEGASRTPSTSKEAVLAEWSELGKGGLSSLGRAGGLKGGPASKGKKKTMTPAAIEARKAQMKKINEKRLERKSLNQK